MRRLNIGFKIKTLAGLVQASTERFSHNISVIYKQGNLSYQALSQRINNFSEYLLNNGLNYQDRAAIFLPNGSLFVITFFALAKIGAVAITLNTNYKEGEIRDYLTGMSVKYLVSELRLKNICEKVIYGTNISLIVVDSESGYPQSRKNRLNNFIRRVYPYSEVLQQFSSGSTGKPKIASRTHFNILSEAVSVAKTIKIYSKDKVLCVVPLYHAYGFGSAMMPALYSGATLILLNKFNPREVLELLKKNKVTIFFGVPYMFSLLADIVLDKKINFPHLRSCFSAGISLPKEISKKFYDKFGVYVWDLYGTTETGCISVNLNKRVEDALDSVGLPIKRTKIEIIQKNGKKAKLGQTGEIIVKTATCGKWYYIGNKKIPLFKNGYFHTGDIGKKDKKGNLYILGRKTSFINVAGTKVDPKEVEEVLKNHPNVKEAVVVGFPDKLRGEVVKAVVVLENKSVLLDKSFLLKYCKERLAGFKVPRIIDFKDTLPKSPLGKILKGYL